MSGTNFFTTKTSAVDVALTDKNGNAALVRSTVANIPTNAGYAVGCLLSATDSGSLYVNTGSTTVASFVELATGGSGITQLTGDVTAGPGSGSQVATIANSAVTNAKVAAAAAIDFSKLAALTSANILVGSGANVATSVAVSGNATISNAGVVTVTGATGAFEAGGAITNAGGTLAVGFIPTAVTSPQALSGPGAANITTYQTQYTSTGAGDVVTLADATRIGHLKKISYVAEGGAGDTCVVTPANLEAFTTATLAAVGDYVLFMWNGAAWLVIENVGATLA